MTVRFRRNSLKNDWHVDMNDQNEIDQLLALVRNELGLAFLPDEMIQDLIRQGQLISVPIKEKIPKRNVCMIYDEKRPTGAAVQKLKSILML